MATLTQGKRAQRTTRRAKAGRVAETRSALNMRIQPELRDLIDQAAEIAGKNRTDFVLDAARQAAQTTLLDRVHLEMKPAAFAEFLKQLEAPAQPNARLRRTMQQPAPWE